MKVTFKTGSEANYGSTNGELFFASNTKQIMLNGIKYIPKKLSELTNDSGFLTSITKSMVEGVLTGNITSHTHSYLPLGGGTLTGNLTCNGSYITMSGGAGAKGYSGYFNNPKRSDRASYSHILGDGYAYGTDSISIGAAAYAGIRNTDSDSATYPYLHWQWMSCMKMQEITDAGNVNCYGAILTNAGGDKDTVKFNSICINDVRITYDESRGASDEVNQFLSFTNTDANYGRVVVYIADNKSGDSNERIFGGTTSNPRYRSNVKIGDYVLGQGCVIRDIVSRTINGVTVYRVAFYFWDKKLSATYDITKETTAMVCTKVNNANYSGASSYASGEFSVASGCYSVASGTASVASGYSSVASGYSSVASGESSVASGYRSVASGYSSVASGYSSVASGYSSVASGYSSVASGESSVASGNYSVASGTASVASGYYSVASGNYSVASGSYSVAMNFKTLASYPYQFVIGRRNAAIDAPFVIGNGSGDSTSDANATRQNCCVIDWSGNATFGVGGAATVTAANFVGSASKLSSHIITDLVYRTIYTPNATGIIIKTDVAANRDIMVNVHIWGNSYFKTYPIDTYIQFYNYNSANSIIQYGCTHLGYNFGSVYAFIYNSLVYIWFDITGTGFPTINAFVGINADGGTYNHLTSITNDSKPTSGVTREVEITPKINAFTDSNVASATKLANKRTITVGSKSLSFDGSANVEFKLSDIITKNDTIKAGEITVEESITSKSVTINNHLELGANADVSGLTPTKIGAAAASHTHSYLPLSGGTMSNTSLVTNLNADLLDGYHASSFYTFKSIRSDQNSIYDLRYNYGTYDKGDYNGTYKDEYPTGFGMYLALAYKDNNTGALMFFDAPLSNVLGHIYVRTRGAGDKNTTYSEWGTLAYLTDNVASASKLATARKITIGSTYKSFDGSGDIEFTLGNIITQSDTINVGTLNVASDATINGALTVGGDISGELSNKLSITLGSTTTTYDNTDNKSITINPSTIGAAAASHMHTFDSITNKPTTLNGYGIEDAYTKTETNTELGKYLPLTGGTLNGALTVPTLTSTGGILLGDSSLSAMVGSVGIQRHDETGFIGFLKELNLDNSFNGVVLGWDGNYQLSTNSVRIDASTFTYKGNNVWHSGNLKLGYISSGLSRAVQKDTNGNLYIVAPSLFEQGISDNYPKNLRWSNEAEGQLVYDKDIDAGNFDIVEIGIPLANGASKGFLKSTSTIANVTGYTPCPVVSGTPYYKEDCLYLGSTEIGYTGIMGYGIQHTYNYGTNHSYLEDYTPDSIPRCVVLCFPDRSSNYRFLFWLSAFDEEDPYIARFYNSAYETWLTIDTASRLIILSYGNTWQS